MRSLCVLKQKVIIKRVHVTDKSQATMLSSYFIRMKYDSFIRMKYDSSSCFTFSFTFHEQEHSIVTRQYCYVLAHAQLFRS